MKLANNVKFLDCCRAKSRHCQHIFSNPETMGLRKRIALSKEYQEE